MKKLSTLIAIALMLVIGSVYAAWSYAQGTTASNEITREINMAQVNTDSNKGSIVATPNDVAFLVDDLGTQDWVAELTGTGKFTLKFIPAAGADASLSTTGIKMIATVTVVYTGTDAPTYEGVDSEGNTVKVVPLQAKTGGANVITIQGDGVNGTTELTVAQIIGALDFCEGKSVKLPTKADNDKFHEVLKNYTIKIVVSEVVTGN
jgi:hypothetical protein